MTYQFRVDVALHDRFKRALAMSLPHVKSSHRAEALARGLGYGSNAALIAALKDAGFDGACLGSLEPPGFHRYLESHRFMVPSAALMDVCVAMDVMPLDASRTEARWVAIENDDQADSPTKVRMVGILYPDMGHLSTEIGDGLDRAKGPVETWLTECLEAIHGRRFVSRGINFTHDHHIHRRYMRERRDPVMYAFGGTVVRSIHVGFGFTAYDLGPCLDPLPWPERQAA